MVEQQEIEQKTEIEMFKFLRDASKENRLSDDFFRKSNFKPMYSTRLDSDPLDSAEIYYKQRVDAKKLLGLLRDTFSPMNIAKSAVQNIISTV